MHLDLDIVRGGADDGGGKSRQDSGDEGVVDSPFDGVKDGKHDRIHNDGIHQRRSHSTKDPESQCLDDLHRIVKAWIGLQVRLDGVERMAKHRRGYPSHNRAEDLCFLIHFGTLVKIGTRQRTELVIL